uniref:Reverse transcriptase domain-containing protein n=1 Tax=Megaselia scalaris TaxID=36166 RepID=T1GUA7_MEGSC
FFGYHSISILPALSKKHVNTTTAVLNITDDIRFQIDNNLYCFLFLLDLSRAFDMIDHNILLYKLRKKLKFLNVACKLLKSFLSD